MIRKLSTKVILLLLLGLAAAGCSAQTERPKDTPAVRDIRILTWNIYHGEHQ